MWLKIPHDWIILIGDFLLLNVQVKNTWNNLITFLRNIFITLFGGWIPTQKNNSKLLLIKENQNWQKRKSCPGSQCPGKQKSRWILNNIFISKIIYKTTNFQSILTKLNKNNYRHKANSLKLRTIYSTRKTEEEKLETNYSKLFRNMKSNLFSISYIIILLVHI